MRQINLKQYSNLNASKISTSINLHISNDKKVIDEEHVYETVNFYQTYLQERQKCDKIRLTVQVDVIASNPLFNYVTELPYYVGTKYCCHFNKIDTVNATYNDDDYEFNCGIDIFNNAVLRSKDVLSSSVSGYTLTSTCNDGITIPYINTEYIFNKNNLLQYKEALQTRLQNQNGWYGFINRGHVENDSNNCKTQVINNVQINSFVDLYPGRSHFSITPYHNTQRNRLEKNWEYCLTYPFSSTTEGFNFINQSLNTLKISHIDENVIDADGLRKTVIYSIIKHGLHVDDIINLYRSKLHNESISEMIEEHVVVDDIIDDYTFSVYLTDYICKNWINIYDDNDALTSNDLTLVNDRYEYTDKNNNQTYHINTVGDYLNADFDDEDSIGSQNLSFTKIVRNQKCKYYARIFKKLLNTENTNLTKIGFSKNIYGDNLGQIVYNDDITIDDKLDNLGRPLTSLYLTFTKTNYGHEEWYNAEFDSSSIEHSHCFGDITCGLKFSPYCDTEKYSVGNINVMNNIDEGYEGYGGIVKPQGQDYFFGDICEYSEVDCNERVLQSFLHRFNTQQRELYNRTDLKVVRDNLIGPVSYDEIIDDTPFTFQTYIFDAFPTKKKEGYYYQPHYQIPIHTFSDTLNEQNIDVYDLVKYENSDDTKTRYSVVTTKYHNFNSNDELYIVNETKHTIYKCQGLIITSPNSLRFNLIDKYNSPYNTWLDSNNDVFKIYRKASDIPPYAEVAVDGSRKYKWRDVVKNGFENVDDKITEYPFTNGCLYINKKINLFVKRQDPFSYFGINDNNGILSLIPTISPAEKPNSPYVAYVTDSDDLSNTNNVINEKDSSC